MEGTPDHHEASPVTRGRSRVVSALSSDLRPVLQGQKPKARPGCSPREGEGGGDRPGRDRGARGSIGSTPWEDNAHARDEAARPLVARQAHGCRSAEAVADVVKRPVPRSCRTEPQTPWGVPAARAARTNREHTRCGCTSFVWVAAIDRTHRASFSSGGRKTSWRGKGASREEVRSSV
jgi:hypothetical protein